MVFPTFFNLSLNLAIRSSRSEPQSAPGLVFADCIELLHLKSRKSRNTWSNRQIWPWNTEWSRAKANRVLLRKCTGHNKHPLPTNVSIPIHIYITYAHILSSIWWRPSIQKTLYRKKSYFSTLIILYSFNRYLLKIKNIRIERNWAVL